MYRDQLTAGGVVYLEKVDASKNERKYWTCRLVPSITQGGGKAVEVAWGRIGTKGVITQTTWRVERCVTRIREKLEEGYVDRTDMFSLMWKIAKPSVEVSSTLDLTQAIVDKISEYATEPSSPELRKTLMATYETTLTGRIIDFED